MTPLLLISLAIGLAVFASVFAAWREIKHFGRAHPAKKPLDIRARGCREPKGRGDKQRSALVLLLFNNGVLKGPL